MPRLKAAARRARAQRARRPPASVAVRVRQCISQHQPTVARAADQPSTSRGGSPGKWRQRVPSAQPLRAHQRQAFQRLAFIGASVDHQAKTSKEYSAEWSADDSHGQCRLFQYRYQ